MLGCILDGELLECEVGDTRPLTPIDSSGEGSIFSEKVVTFGEFTFQEIYKLIVMGYALAEDVRLNSTCVKEQSSVKQESPVTA